MFGIGDDIRAGKSNPIIQLQYNYRCNFSCEHCSIAPFRIVQNRRSLTPADVKAIFDQADEMGFARAVITGGEPLIFPDLSAVISAIGPERFYISIDTNGYYLTSAVVGWLKDKLVDRVQLSIDSFYAEEHDAFRRKRLSYAKAVNGLKECLRQKLDVFISTVVTKERLYSDEFKNFLEWGAEMGVDIFVTFAKPVGAWAGREDVMIDRQDLLYMRSLESRYRVFTHLTPAYGIDMGCIAVKGMISVTQYGDVQPCPYMHISLGNIFQEPLAKIVERGLSTKQFGERVDTCPIATDAEFLAKYNRITKDLE
jgi:MoaA/NifB/PqqE/SkfB family radical SAM enzyme